MFILSKNAIHNDVYYMTKFQKLRIQTNSTYDCRYLTLLDGTHLPSSKRKVITVGVFGFIYYFISLKN